MSVYYAHELYPNGVFFGIVSRRSSLLFCKKNTAQIFATVSVIVQRKLAFARTQSYYFVTPAKCSDLQHLIVTAIPGIFNFKSYQRRQDSHCRRFTNRANWTSIISYYFCVMSSVM